MSISWTIFKLHSYRADSILFILFAASAFRKLSTIYLFRYFPFGYRYHKLRKTFSKFYRRHCELVSKFNVGLKTLLHQGLSEPEFYGDLVYKFKKKL